MKIYCHTHALYEPRPIQTHDGQPDESPTIKLEYVVISLDNMVSLFVTMLGRYTAF